MITSSDRPTLAISMTSWLVNRLRNIAPSWTRATHTATNKKNIANRPAIALRWAVLIADHPPVQVLSGCLGGIIPHASLAFCSSNKVGGLFGSDLPSPTAPKAVPGTIGERAEGLE